MLISESRLRQVIFEELESAFERSPDSSQIISTLRNIVTGVGGYLRAGSSGLDVALLQLFLQSLNYDLGDFGPEGDGIDGKYGRATADAVKDYQQDVNNRESGDAFSGSPIFEDGNAADITSPNVQQ